MDGTHSTQAKHPIVPHLASDKWLIIILCVKAFNDDGEEEEARKMLHRSIMNIIMLI